MPKCQECGKARTTEPDYDPIRLINGAADPGWYSSSNEGELCGPCLVGLYREESSS